MDPRHLSIDNWLIGVCVYCGANPDTREHVPSRVLLDKPYPPDLPVVGACKSCNISFSLDEQYLATFLECVICGSTETTSNQRSTVKRILNGNSNLQERIENSKKTEDSDNLLWEPEVDRIRNVVLKLARGHFAFELYPIFQNPVVVSFVPLQLLKENERITLEHLNAKEQFLLPEIGSRAFLRNFRLPPYQHEHSGDWIIVQPNRYRYMVTETSSVFVRMVLSEYLACEVIWEK